MKNRPFACLLASACIMPSAAWAADDQEGPASPAVTPAELTPEEATAGEIIVTAQKRSQSLQRVPLSIDVVTAEAIADRHIQGVSELPSVVPGFEFSRAPNQIPSLTFRGLGPQAGNVAFDSSIGMFVDGVFLGNVRLYNQTLFDVERAELIKGTQSALLGKNTTIGALSIINAAASLGDFSGRIEGGGEVQNGGYYVDGMINLPVGQDAALRVAGYFANDDGYIKNITTDLWGPTNRDVGARASLLWEPSPELRLTARYQYTDNRTIGSAIQALPPGLVIPGLPGAPFTTAEQLLGDAVENRIRASFSFDPRLHDGDDYLRQRIHLASLTADYDFGGVTLTSITAGILSKNTSNLDFDWDNKDANIRLRSEEFDEFTQEFRLTSNDPSAFFSYIFGLYYYRSTFHLDEFDGWGIADFPPDPANPLYGQLFNGSYSMDFDQTANAYSGFGQLTFKPSSKLTFNLGGRYSYERKVVHWGREPDPTNLTLWNTVIQAPFPYQRLNPTSDKLLSGSVSLQYQLSPAVMAYASASRGGKAGGYGEFAGVPADFSLPPIGGLPQGNPNVSALVKPERANAYEIGFKSSLLDRKVTLNAAAFWTDLFNLQQLFFNGQFVVTNDRVRAKGFEASLDVRPLKGLTVSASGVYADVKDLRTGLTTAQSPRWSGSATVSYETDLSSDYRMTLRSSVDHRSSKFNQLGETQPDGEFTTFALGMRVDAEAGWWVNAAAENAFNAFGADFGFNSADPFVGRLVTTSPLRTITLSAGIKF